MIIAIGIAFVGGILVDHFFLNGFIVKMKDKLKAAL